MFMWSISELPPKELQETQNILQTSKHMLNDRIRVRFIGVTAKATPGYVVKEFFLQVKKYSATEVSKNGTK